MGKKSMKPRGALSSHLEQQGRLQEFLRLSGNRPETFKGSVMLPPSKSYFHRALFTACLAKGKSTVSWLGGGSMSDDARATLRFLRSMGARLQKVPGEDAIALWGCDSFHTPKGPVYVGGSGTTARFAISFAALAADSGRTTIIGDHTLSKRPMNRLLEALAQLGVRCRSEGRESLTLPVTVWGGGIRGGRCVVDSSISSQYISSLLISCTRAREDCTIEISNPDQSVSEPYVEATLAVLRRFGFEVTKMFAKDSHNSEKRKRGATRAFFVRAGQAGVGKHFRIPGDMSSAAALVGAALCCLGEVKLRGMDAELPQPDSAILPLAEAFGAKISASKKGTFATVKARRLSDRRDGGTLLFDLKDSPDIAPVVVAIAAGVDREVKIRGVGHLRFKESDRLSTLAEGFGLLGVRVGEARDSIAVLGSKELRKPCRTIDGRKPLVLDPRNDHRMLMAFAIAGLSGRFGEFFIKDPSCINKSYPGFISDLSSLCKYTNRLDNPLAVVAQKDKMFVC